MLSAIENYYAQKEEPQRGCLLALRSIILKYDDEISAEWKYRMPFFCVDGKMMCYLWLDKQSGDPYVGIVNGGKIDHSALEQGSRSRMKILRVNPNKDLPIKTIEEVLKLAMEFHKNKK